MTELVTRVGQHKYIYKVLDLARCSGGSVESRHSAQVVLAIPIFWFQHLFPFEAATDSYDGASK